MAENNKSNNNESIEHALTLLKDGNHRFFSMRSKVTPAKLLDQRVKSQKEQKPYAIIICCSDSRINPEYIFDQGIGQLHVIRTAGNIITSSQIGSIEYAITLFNPSLIVVLGHSDCHAVQQTLQVLQGKQSIASPYVEYIQNKISPAITNEANMVKEFNPNYIEDLNLDSASGVNIRYSLSEVSKRSLLVQAAVQDNTLQVTGAFYDLESGLVGFID